MRRRDFLAGGLSIAGALATRSAQAQPVKRAAVVIGVDKVGDLPRLNAAASGARAVADWLQAEGFEVKRFIDGQKPVVVGDIKPAIRELVSRGTLEQLVVYFAGHGFIGLSSEFWLLSGARQDGDEAISLTEAREASRNFGIPNVVFISDACRSLADSLQTRNVKGALIFPNTPPVGQVTTEVDKFLATRIGDFAWEVPVANSVRDFQGIYTTCFLDAFRSPYQTMVQVVDGRPVVPNRRLRLYLAQEVPKRAQAAGIQLRQNPDAEICSDEPTYIAHVTTTARTADSTPAPTIADVASSAVGEGLGGGTPQAGNSAVRALASASGYEAASNRIAQARGLPAQLGARAGFVISGQNVKSVTAKPGIGKGVSNSTGGPPSALVEVDVSNARAASVALRFADGSGTVVAALDYYVGTVVVDQGRVTSVSYVPSRQSPMWSAYNSEANRLEQLRAAVATAARFGVFRIEGPRNVRSQTGRQLADRIRMLKGIDPTLGLYAAYAYADAGLVDGVRSVRGYMWNDLGGVDLFDVLMLTGEMSGKPAGNTGGPYPFCPMLSQGWGLLRVRDVRLPERIVALREHLRVSLWTTFDSEGMQTVEDVLRAGQVSQHDCSTRPPEMGVHHRSRGARVRPSDVRRRCPRQEASPCPWP